MTTIIGSKVVVSLIERQIATQAISEASTIIYTTIANMFYCNNVHRVIMELDVVQKIKTLEDVCNMLTSENLDENKNNVINVCLDSIHDMIIKIREDLKNINIKLEKHKYRYFNTWRSPRVSKELKNLQTHCSILDQRYLLLVNSVRLFN